MGPRLVRRFTARVAGRKKRAEPPRSSGGLASLLVATGLIVSAALWARATPMGELSAGAGVDSQHPAGSSAPRRIAVSPVRPRPGVPQELAAGDWLAEVADPSPSADGGSVWEAGSMGTTARLILPPGEVGLAVGGGFLATTESSSTGSLIRVREITTGVVQRSIQSDQRVAHAALVGQLLFWSGWVDAGHASDAGVRLLDLADTASLPQTIVDGGMDLRPFGPEAGRGPFHASSTGNTIVSSVGAGGTTRVDVIDVAARTRVGTLANEIVLAITDDAAFVLRPSGIARVDFRSGATAWEKSTGRVFAVLASSDQALVAFDRGDAYVISAIADDGTMRDLKTQSGLARGHVRYLAAALSTPASLVLLPDLSLGASLSAHQTATALVLDPATGQMSPDSFQIGAP
jgi:hypothetical protein